jgi:hypothetical protein
VIRRAPAVIQPRNAAEEAPVPGKGPEPTDPRERTMSYGVVLVFEGVEDSHYWSGGPGWI